MNSRIRFLNAIKLKPLKRPPLWVMRQAGRYLPEYREIKKQYHFTQMVKTPEIAAEVTLQPLKRFALDAAIIFSDILVIPEALGMPYTFREQGGIEMDGCISTRDDVLKLDKEGITEKLEYVAQSLKLVKESTGAEKALIGFCGSPWTVATYMVEGGSTRDFSKSKALLRDDPNIFHSLLEIITEASIEYIQMQIQAGIDVVQVFDSWGGVLDKPDFWEGTGRYMQTITQAIHPKVPVIIYSKGSHDKIDDLKKIRGDVYGVDSTKPIAEFSDELGGMTAVQGNLDPEIMSTDPQSVQIETQKILDEFGERKGLIFNLGHGIKPDGKIECMHALVDTVTDYEFATIMNNSGMNL
ncbi:MAG: uroporphyrinogen decarboxylase [Candidatus Marinimicrobia bacterium]|nr:uroporphyrinogen decarboxylase [Candidatus Neomarinimicrobiota bacterium]